MKKGKEMRSTVECKNNKDMNSSETAARDIRGTWIRKRLSRHK